MAQDSHKTLPRKDWAEILRRITDGLPVNENGVLIEIPEGVQSGRVTREFNLINCVVRGVFLAKRILFAESVSFANTIFENGLDLDGCSIDGNLFLNDAIIRENASFEGLTVTRHAFFDRCTFEVQPNFGLAHFGSFTSFKEVVFAAGAFFISGTFDGHLALNNLPDCRGPVDLSLATIGGPLHVNESKFLGSLIGNSMKVSGPILLTDTEFGPDATLSLFRATVEGQLKLERCTFKNEKAVCLNLDGIAVAGGCEMNHVVCLGEFRMNDARISRFLWIGEVDEKNIENPTQHYTFFASQFSLSSLRLDGALTCAGIAFSPPPKDGAETPVAPDDKLGPPDFSGMRVDDRVYIMGCNFPRGANFNRADIGGVFGLSASSKRSISFEGTRFQKAARFLRGCVLEQGANFYFAQFGDEANFGGARVAVELNLSYAQLNDSLLFDHKGDIVRFSDEKVLTQVVLRGCTYTRLVLPAEYSGLKEFLARVPATDTNSFVFLEQYLRKSGRRELANQVRIHWNECEIAQMLVPSFRWFWRYAHKHTTSYGTTPTCLIIIAVIVGVANVAAPYFGMPKTWLTTFQVVSATLGAFLLSLATDALRRRVWPE